MEQNKQKEEKPKDVFSTPDRVILAGLSRNVEALSGAIERLTEQLMELTKKK